MVRYALCRLDEQYPIPGGMEFLDRNFFLSVAGYSRQDSIFVKVKNLDNYFNIHKII